MRLAAAPDALRRPAPSTAQREPGGRHTRIAGLGGRLSRLKVIDLMGAYPTVREVAVLARCEHKSVRRTITAGPLRAFQPTNRLLIREGPAARWRVSQMFRDVQMTQEG